MLGLTITPQAPSWRVPAREAATIGPWVAAGGIVLALGWRPLAVLLRSVSEPGEAAIAADAAFAAIAFVLGLVTAVMLAMRPGRAPVTRFVVGIALAALAGLAAWPAGEFAGAPRLHALGALVLWPTVAAVGQLLWTIVRLVTDPE